MANAFKQQEQNRLFPTSGKSRSLFYSDSILLSPELWILFLREIILNKRSENNVVDAAVLDFDTVFDYLCYGFGS